MSPGALAGLLNGHVGHDSSPRSCAEVINVNNSISFRARCCQKTLQFLPVSSIYISPSDHSPLPHRHGCPHIPNAASRFFPYLVLPLVLVSLYILARQTKAHNRSLRQFCVYIYRIVDPTPIKQPVYKSVCSPVVRVPPSQTSG
jgi:hypothetical protein